MQAINIPCMISIGCNTKCVFGSANEAGGVRYRTENPIVRSSSCKVAMMGVVVIPISGKRIFTWMGSNVMVSGQGVVDAAYDGASGGVINSGLVDTVYM